MALRMRFAPSPTGHLHVGGARTALFNSLLAASSKDNDGSLVLRIEDTDTKRSSRAYEVSIMEDLEWLGITWDEGPDREGPYGPYRQSERLGIYNEHAQRLLEQDKAYKCYCSEERLEKLRKEQLRGGKPPRYDGACLRLKRAPSNSKYAVRFKVDNLDGGSSVVFNDALRGKVEYKRSAFGDFIIIGSDGIAAYNLAVVVDDALMEISHVMRGDDHLPNTPRQILLQRALGFEEPRYIHVPLVLSSEREPLGKRHEGYSIKELRAEGFLPEAVINAIARLGWSPPEDLYNPNELAELFAIERLSKSPSIFETERLHAYGKVSIEKAGTARLVDLICEDFRSIKKDELAKAIEAVKYNCFNLEDIRILIASLVEGTVHTDSAREILSKDYAHVVLSSLRRALSDVEALDKDVWKKVTKNVSKDTGEKGKRLYEPIRAALTGTTVGIEVERVALFIGRDKALRRIDNAIGGKSGT